MGRATVTDHQHKFQEGWQEATCTLGLHEPPVALASCTCGFYAYHRGEDLSPYHYGGERKVEALVAGRGLVTLGSKGWRAEHLRLVALVGKAAPSPLATWGRRLSQVGAEHFTFFTVIVILGFFTGGSLTSWPLLLIQGLLTFLLLVNSVLHLLLPEEYFSGVNSLPQGVLEALRNTYPHLPIYETLEEAWQAQEEGAHGHP